MRTEQSRSDAASLVPKPLIMMGHAKEITVNRDVIWDDVDGNVVICRVSRNEFFHLNKTAGIVWRAMIDGGVASAEETLRAVFAKTPSETIRADVEKIVDDFLSAGLVSPTLTGLGVHDES